MRHVPMLLALVGLACGCSDDAGGEEAADRGDPPTEGVETSDGAPAGDAGPDGGPTDAGDSGGGDSLSVVVKGSHLRAAVPADEPTALNAWWEGPNKVSLHLLRLEVACGPVPSFRAHVADGSVVLRLQPPDETSDCVGNQEMKVRVSPVSDVTNARVLDTEGDAIVSATITDEE